MSERMDEEAARRLMILLCGSEAEAEKMYDAVMRYATPEEEEMIKRQHRQAQERAREAGKDTVIPLHPKLHGIALNEAAEPSLTAEEEAEFDEFMRKVYERVESENKN